MITHPAVPPEWFLLYAFGVYAVGRFVVRYIIDHWRHR